MRLRSTRGGETVSLDDALMRGIANDGGLFVPDVLPTFTLEDFASARSLQDTARILLTPFFASSALQHELDDIVSETYSFPVPTQRLGAQHAWLLELFHGPTAAFKDVGAGFLAACLTRLHRNDGGAPLVILVATSGDTGGAVAAAFDGRAGVNVVVLFPKGRVSERQAKQLTCWSDNILSLEIDGSFDDCQALVKSAFADPELSARYRFSSANSINIGRLLPQSTYYAHASLEHIRATGNRPGFIVPTGNLGNGLACILARDMGLPIGDIILATNANRLISDYLGGAEWLPRASVQTLATAMDVGDPSNMERLRDLHGGSEELGGLLRAISVSDAEIEAEIRAESTTLGMPICPHTATGFHAYHALNDREREDDWIIVATAHAAKFESIVEPLIGTTVPIPDALERILDRPSRYQTIDASMISLGEALHDGIRVDGDG